MLSDLLWLVILLIFILPGLRYPYIALSGVVFVDLVKPQTLSYGFLAGKPISLIITFVFFFSFLVNLRQNSFPTSKLPILVLIGFMIWMTLSTYNALFQNLAWIKYDYVIKTLLFALFIPFVINTRLKAETFAAVIVCAISFFTITAGVKTIFGGGGYGHQFFSMNVRTGAITETSTLSMVAVMSIPFILYLKNHSLFKAESSYIKYGYIFLIITATATVFGTFARTGLIALTLWLGLIFKSSERKLVVISAILISATIVLLFLPDAWFERMGTLSNVGEESSAYGRLVVWFWTLDFIKENPLLGGGFYSYFANAGELFSYSETDINISHADTGKAYHNIYFEVAGDLGLVGLGFFIAIIIFTYRINSKIRKKFLEDYWISSLALAINQSLIIYCICGNFIGVSYIPVLYYLFGLTVGLKTIGDKTTAQ